MAAVEQVTAQGIVTPDIGGTATTQAGHRRRLRGHPPLEPLTSTAGPRA